MISTADIAARSAEGRLPLVTIDEFFLDNTVDDSLAPNRWGLDLPPLREIAERLRTVEAHADVAWVRIGLHDDTQVDEPNGDVIADAVLLATTLPSADLDQLLDVGWLRGEGIIESDDSSLEDYTEIPPVIGHQRIIFLVWD